MATELTLRQRAQAMAFRLDQVANGTAEQAASIIREQDRLIEEAIDRLADLTAADDGQAYKEAEKFMRRHGKTYGH